MYPGERFNSISHLVGASLALVGASVLITASAFTGSAIEIVSVSVYGATLFLLFLASTLYHSLAGRAKKFFKLLDYQAIYLLIAGTYTPVALVAVEGALGWWLFGVIWGLAAIGIVLEMLPIRGPRIAPVVLYLIMGWCCIFAIETIFNALSATSFGFLIAGGVIYTLGVVFYVLDKWYPWCHEIWHLFVLGGSVSHYFAIALI